MKLLRILLRYSPGTVFLAVVMGSVSGLSSTGLLAVLNGAIHRLSEGRAGELMVPFLALAGLFSVARLLSGYFLDRVSQGTVFALRTNLSWDILGTPLSRLESAGSHRLTAVLTTDISNISGALQRISQLCINAAIVIGGLSYLGWLSSRLILLVLCVLPFGAAGYLFTALGARDRQRRAREVADLVFEHYRGVTEGTKELQLNRKRRHAFMGRLQEVSRQFQKLRLESLSMFRIASTWGQLLLFLLIGSLVFLLPRWMDLSPETVTGAALVLLYILGPLQTVLDALPDLAHANVSVDKIENLGLSPTRSRGDSAGEPAQVPVRAATLELRGVRYRYSGEEEGRAGFGVGPIDLRLEPGELVFLTGGNGSGKTTLAKLITLLYIPMEGEIRLNGLLVTPETREWCRQHISAVFSDFYLFRELLGLNQESRLEKTVGELLEHLQLSRKVRLENGSLSTLNLSQGQRKRLALLVSRLEDRPIVLFDEWAADQDPYFRKFFYNTILPELRERQKTVVVISHDDRYYAVADRVLKLDQGIILSEESSREPVAVVAGQRMPR